MKLQTHLTQHSLGGATGGPTDISDSISLNPWSLLKSWLSFSFLTLTNGQPKLETWTKKGDVEFLQRMKTPSPPVRWKPLSAEGQTTWQLMAIYDCWREEPKRVACTHTEAHPIYKETSSIKNQGNKTGCNMEEKAAFTRQPEDSAFIINRHQPSRRVHVSPCRSLSLGNFLQWTLLFPVVSPAFFLSSGTCRFKSKSTSMNQVNSDYISCYFSMKNPIPLFFFVSLWVHRTSWGCAIYSYGWRKKWEKKIRKEGREEGRRKGGKEKVRKFTNQQE